MRIILLGPPGSGKGTQALLLSRRYNIPHISAGIVLHQELHKYSELDITYRKIVDTIHGGDLVNDEFINKLIFTRISQNDCLNGFILDGFPRTMIQAISISEKQIKINFIVQFILPDSIIIDRIIGRRVHLKSGRTYHVKFNPPKNFNLDDVTGEVLTIRKDDHEYAIRTRLNKYHQHSQPLINYYKNEAINNKLNYLSIDGNREINEVYQELIKIFLYDINYQK